MRIAAILAVMLATLGVFAGTNKTVSGEVEFLDCKNATKLTGTYSDIRIPIGTLIIAR